MDQRENETVDYADVLTTPRPYRRTDRYLLTGDNVASYVQDYRQMEGRWPLPAPDVNGVCSDMNSVRWYINQDLPPCSRPVPSYSCSGALDPAYYTTAIKVQSPGWFNAASTVMVNVTLGEVWWKDETGLLKRRPSDTVVSATGIGCQCQGILLEARYRVYSDQNQKYIRTVYADIVTGDTKDCSPVQQKFSVQFFSRPDGQKRSGNPGYQPSLPVLFKLSDASTSLSHFALSGLSVSGQCPTILNQTLTLNSTEIAFLSESILSCYLELSLADLRQYCLQNSNPLSPIFALDSVWPLYVAKFGNAEAGNSEDFVPFEVNKNSMNPKWSEENATCTISNTMLFEFVVTDVGFHVNPQSKIVYAKAAFLNNTYFFPRNWRFLDTVNSTSVQKFFNTVLVTFLRYDKDRDFYQEVGVSSPAVGWDVRDSLGRHLPVSDEWGRTVDVEFASFKLISLVAAAKRSTLNINIDITWPLLPLEEVFPPFTAYRNTAN